MDLSFNEWMAELRRLFKDKLDIDNAIPLAARKQLWDQFPAPADAYFHIDSAITATVKTSQEDLLAEWHNRFHIELSSMVNGVVKSMWVYFDPSGDTFGQTYEVDPIETACWSGTLGYILRTGINAFAQGIGTKVGLDPAQVQHLKEMAYEAYGVGEQDVV